ILCCSLNALGRKPIDIRVRQYATIGKGIHNELHAQKVENALLRERVHMLERREARLAAALARMRKVKMEE
ncbi:unnamed protein product, partial [Heterosigma akashiwo]